MDEPSASLDYGNKLRVMETVKSLTRDDYTIIQSTHDPVFTSLLLQTEICPNLSIPLI